jgi:curved DNA-binding protein CbpA
MGNQWSNNYNENSVIKSLYAMDETELNNINRKLNYDNINKNHILLLNRLKRVQMSIKDSIPYSKYNKVNNFLESVELSILQENQKRQSYFQNEEQMEKQFLLDQERKRQEFYETQKTRRFKYEGELKTFKHSKIDSRQLFKLGQTFTMDELKIAYRNLARRFHPDRPGGNNDKFQVITKAYMTLMEELKVTEIDKPYNELKQQSRNFYENQNNEQKRNLKLSSDKFDIKLFNKIYEENKLHDVNDDGYSDWLKKANIEEEGQKPDTKLFSKKFNVNVFNNIFDEKAKQNKEVIKHNVPEGVAFGNFSNNNNMLGVDKVENYSDTGYSDLFEAHSNTNFVNSRGYSKKDTKLKTLEEIKAERSEISNLSMEEIRAIESNKKIEEEKEEHRINSLKKKDEFIEGRFNQLNKQMISNNLLSNIR